VAAADRLGLDGVWSAEHVGMNDGVVPSAAYLGITDRIEIGIVGCNTDTRHPGLLAMEIASLTDLGPGRLRLQVGTGDPQLAMKIGASRPVRPVENVEALVHSLRELVGGHSTSVTAPGFTLDHLKLRHKNQPPPIDIMAIRPRMLELAATTGDGVALSLGASKAYLKRVVGEVEGHLDRLGRDRSSFRITALTVAGIDDDLAAARNRVARNLAFATGDTADLLTDGVVPFPEPADLAAAMHDGGPKAAAELFADETVEELGLVATPETLVLAIDAYAATGIDELGVVASGNPARSIALVEQLAAARS
jgi:alkanesulfonate monooxygenase SsuD/methylene tetrahydromethanopterin reductase-like flavin-dependent oxidoreductase (luciferase family)